MKRHVYAIRYLAILITGITLLHHSPATGQDISPENSYCEWHGLAGDGAAVVCPAGDGPSYIQAYIRDVNNDPIEGAGVYHLNVSADCADWFCGQVVYTDANGIAIIYPTWGSGPDSPACCSVGTTVMAGNIDPPDVTLSWGVGGPLEDTRYWKSFDLDGNGIVNGVLNEWGDLLIFSQDFNTTACRTDYSGDGQVGLMDLATFNNHALHASLVVDPPEFDFGTLPPGELHCEPLTLQNWGNGSVSWNLTTDCPWVTMSTGGGEPTQTLAGTIPAPPSEPPHPDAQVVVNICVDTAGLSEGEHHCDISLTSGSSYPECLTPSSIGVTVVANPVVGVPGDGIPTAYKLHPARPNPFNPLTTIRYDLPEPGRVVLRVFDLTGRVVRVLKGGVAEEAGRRQAVWNGLDDSGRAVASGVYLCRLEVGDFRDVTRMMLVR